MTHWLIGSQNQDIHFTEEERDSYLDLRPYLNPTPYTVPKVNPLKFW